MGSICYSLDLWNFKEDEHLIRSRYLYPINSLENGFYLSLEITFKEIIPSIKFKFDKYISAVLRLKVKMTPGQKDNALSYGAGRISTGTN